jgi:adenine-specific DNA-methyltransferase
MDEVFGRANFVANIVWQKKYAKQNDATWLSTSHDHILLFCRNKERWRPYEIQRTEGQLKGYSNPDNDPRGAWQSVVYTCAKSRAERPNLYYPITHPKTGKKIYPSETRVWGYDPARYERHAAEGRIWWGADGEKDKPRLKTYLREVGVGIVPDTLWLRDEVGDNQDGKREARAFNENDAFATPKPESLLRRVLEIATREGDWVLDSFAGSGTTGAVAHKMGRHWIMVELGEHCHTHIIPRLNKVIDGADSGGITEAVGWNGGGGFRYYTLAPSLLQKDQYGNWVINKKYNAAMLAEAVCKLAGFAYAPSDSVYWQHGHSTETDFIYVTTQPMTREQLARLSEEVGEKRTLMVYCTAFRVKPTAFPNLTLKKIPKAVLSKCEWGHDDYSLEIKNLPAAPPEEEGELLPAARASVGRRRLRPEEGQPGLFDNAGHGEPALPAGRSGPTPEKESRR